MIRSRKKARTQEATPLLYADTQHSADQLYFGNVSVPDPFVAIGPAGRKIAVVSALEYSRVVKESDFEVVLPLETLRAEARRRFPRSDGGPAGVIRVLAARYGITCFRIPYAFPAGLAFALRKAGVRLEVAAGALFPERAHKSDSEAAEIRKANRVAAAGFRRVEQILAESVARRGRLYWCEAALTSERAREEIGKVCLERNALASGTIVAGGDQACDPHCRGSGPLRPNELIIVDIFPRLDGSGYHGDMTRTYLKGRPTAAQRKLVATVREAHRRAIDRIAPGRSADAIHRDTVRYFEEAGYPTERRDGAHCGFFHGLGHGLGLEVHEAPRLAPNAAPLKRGHVVTVEPGLYYPGLGGCRIEDVVRVGGATGCERLSRHPYRWCYA